MTQVPNELVTGLGSAALLTAGTGANNAVQLDGTGKLPAVDGSLLTGIATGGGGIIDSQTFLSSGTWTKPVSGTYAIVRLWGGGASGGKGSLNSFVGAGGGGGAYNESIFLLSSLNATESIIIGAGGASVTILGTLTGNDGGTSSFGISMKAYGGGGGYGTGLNNSGGGGGGGILSTGRTGTNPTITVGTIQELVREYSKDGINGSFGGAPFGGHPAVLTNSILATDSANGGGGGGTSNNTGFGKGGSSINGGGGGGGQQDAGIGPAGSGGSSVNGGGGGGGGAFSVTIGRGIGGISDIGGNGGNGGEGVTAATAGIQPSGGGGGSYTGNSGAGGDGKCIVIVI